MCGIAGLITPNGRPWRGDQAAQIVRAMVGSLRHRGPDSSGQWSDPDGRCVIGQRRLSVIDTSDAGLQPFPSGDGRWQITYNGEIYNFQEIQPELVRAGVRLRGRTDTEVLIESLALWGPDALPRLDGMFAFAAFDTQTGQTLIARDPFGEKPLYYVKLPGGGLAFASELQALERLPGFDAEVSMDSIAELLSFQYVGAPRTIYRCVKKLPPGCWMRIDPGGTIQIERYFQFNPVGVEKTTRPRAELADELEDILTRSIKRRLVSDVPLGAFLSGGVDSSTVCALIRARLGVPLKTYSIGFEGAAESEHNTARTFATHIGADHHERILAPQGAERILELGSWLDEPNGDSSCLPTYLLSKFAREDVTVAISGDGGDEMFGGYGRYLATLNEQAQGGLPGWAAGNVYYGDRILVTNDVHLGELFGPLPAPFRYRLSSLRSELNSADPKDLLDSMRRHDVDHYMPGAVLAKVDRMAMRHSLEVRTPFLSVELARFAETLPSDVLVDRTKGKLLLRDIAYRYLPRALIDLPKQGFGLPMADWAREGLLKVAGELLEGADSRLASCFGGDAVRRFLRRHREQAFSVYQVWAVTVLEAWLRGRTVNLPTIGDRWAWAPRGPAAAREQRLELLGMAPDFYLARVGADEGRRPISDAVDELSDEATRLARRLIGEHDRDAPFKPTTFSQPLTGQVATSGSLAGATLFFIDEDASTAWDPALFNLLADLGVARAIARSQANWQEFHDIAINGQIPEDAQATALAYLENRIATVGMAPGDSAQGLTHAEPAAGRSYTTHLGHYISAPTLDNVIVFEGLRQLPPFSSSLRDVAELGAGRLSLTGGHLQFSRSGEQSAGNDAIWIAPRLPHLAGRTRYIHNAIHLDQIRPAQRPRAFESLFSEAEAPPLDLKPGDRVVVCTHALPAGGAERQWVYLARWLKTAGYDVTFVTFVPLTGDNAHYAAQLKAHNIPIVCAEQAELGPAQALRDWPHTIEALCDAPPDSFTHLENARQLATTFRAIRPKVVFAQLDSPNIRAGLGAHIAGVPRVVLSFRNTIPTHFPYLADPTFRPMYQLLARSPRARFTANHAGAARDYAAWLGLPERRIACIPNAIDTAAFPSRNASDIAALRQTLGVDQDSALILGAFRLSAEKEPATFIDVCRRVLAVQDNAVALIAGAGPMEAEVRAQIEALGLSGRIRLLGRRDDVADLMSCATLLLLTSRFEGMPNVLMEAQMAGLPVVATDAGGARDTLHPDAGILCPVGDVDALTQACMKIVKSPDVAVAMADAGRRHAMSAYPPERMAQAFLDAARQHTSMEAVRR